MADPTLPRFDPNAQAAVVPFFHMWEGEECVKVQIAGETRFSPVYRAHDMAERDGLREITYAERWPEQYAQFKSGETQIADGTALIEMASLSQSRIADLRQLKIYTVEALAELDDRNIARLGGDGYKLKNMAREWLATRMQRGSDNKIAQMQQQIEALTAMLQRPEAPTETNLASYPPIHTAENPKWVLEAEQKIFDRQFGVAEVATTDTETSRLKEEIKAKTGSYPRGNPSLETLRRILSELDGE